MRVLSGKTWRRALAAGFAFLLPVAPAWAGASAQVWQGQFDSMFGANHFESDSVPAGEASVSQSLGISLGSGQLAWVANARANTRTGALGTEAIVDRIDGPQGGVFATPGIWSVASVFDELQFGGTRAGWVEFTAQVTGSFESLLGSAFRSRTWLTTGAQNAELTFRWVNNLSSPLVSVHASPGTTGIADSPGALRGTLHLLRYVSPGDQFVLQLEMALTVGPDNLDHAVGNFGHTAQLGVRLPEGLSFTSSSGTFLIDAPTPPVPEPQSFALLITGLALVSWHRRCRSRRPV